MNIKTVSETDHDYDPTHTQELGHGNTIAAWALVGTVSVGTIICGITMFLELWPVFIVGLVIIALGIVAGVVLKQMGWGVGGHKTLEREARRNINHQEQKDY